MEPISQTEIIELLKTHKILTTRQMADYLNKNQGSITNNLRNLIKLRMIYRKTIKDNKTGAYIFHYTLP